MIRPFRAALAWGLSAALALAPITEAAAQSRNSFRPIFQPGGGVSSSTNKPAVGATTATGQVPAGASATCKRNGSVTGSASVTAQGAVTCTFGSAIVANDTVSIPWTLTGESPAATATTAPAPLVISGASSTATVGDTTPFTPTISGGTAPFSVTATGLPPGRLITNAATGLTTGGYTTAGSYSVTYTAADNGSPQQTASFTRAVTVTAANVTLQALSLSPNTATIGTAYTGTIVGKASGSTVAVSGAGAAGLSVSGTSVSGTPTATGVVDLVETLSGATNSPRTTSGALTVAAAASVYLPATATAPTMVGGVNRLVSGYVGPAVRVVRASDSAEQDIGFAGDALDTNSALTFQGGSSLTIRTVYDQSGAGNHLTQATASLRPNLYLGEGGPSIMAFSGKSLAIPATVTADRQNVSVFEVARMPSQGVSAGIWEWYDTANSAIDLALRSPASSYAMQPLYGTTTPTVSSVNYQAFNIANTSVYGLVSSSAGTAVHRDEIAVSYPAVTSKAMTTGGQVLRTTAIDGKFDLLAFVVYPAAVSSTETTNIKAALRDIHNAALPATLGAILQGDSITFGTGAVNNRNIASQLALTLGRSAMVRNFGIAGSQASAQTGMWDNLPTRYTVPGKPNILRYHLGKNDLTNNASAATTITSITTTLKAARNNGTANLIVCTPPLPDGRAAWTAAQETQRLLLAAWFRSDPRDDTGARLCDAVDDLNMDSLIGDAATTAGGGAKDISLYPDNLHPSELAIRTRMAPSFTAAVQFLAPAGYSVAIPTTVAAPSNTGLPGISGIPQVGQILSASPGSWSNATSASIFTRLPASYRYQWKLDGVSVSGATRSSYTPVAADAGKVPTVDVTVANAAGTVTVTAPYSTAIAAASSALAISGNPVTTATAGQPYAGFTATATGGTSPYTYSLVNAPSGLTVNSSTGAVSGTVGTTGTYNGIIVRATDSASTPATADLTFNLTVTAAVQQLAISGTPPAGTVGQSYTFTPSASGGTGSYTFSLVSGSVPGSSFNTTTGAVTASSLTTAGSYPIVIRVTDSQSSTADLSVTIVVNAAAQTGYVLDNVSATPAAVYSVRRVRTAYTGPAMKVRRSTDSTTQDIAFTSAGDLDTSTTGSGLMAFCAGASTNCTIDTWYDQGPSALNATQATAANQPRIVANGVLDARNGKPIIVFANSTSLAANLNASPTTRSFRMVGDHRTNANSDILRSSASGGWNLRTAAAHNLQLLKQGGAVLFATTAVETLNVSSIFGVDYDSTNYKIDTDGNANSGTTSAAGFTAGLTTIFGGASSMNTGISTAMFFDGAILPANDDTTIRTSLKSYYGTP